MSGSAGIINPPGKIFGEGYLFGTNNYADDTPFATLTDLTIKDDLGLKELMGPEQLTALAVGVADRKVTLEASVATFKLEQLMLARAGTLSSIAAVVAPIAAPTLTAGAGTTSYTAGYVAVAYSWVTPNGDTAISPIATVLVTPMEQVTVTSLAAAMATAGGTSVNYFMSGQSYPTAAAALAGPLLYAGNTLGTSTILPNYPLPTARVAPLVSSVSIARRLMNFGVNDVQTACRMHFQTPTGGFDCEIFAYNCVIPSIEIPIKNREWTVNKFGFNVYGDPTQPNSPIWQVLTV